MNWNFLPQTVTVNDLLTAALAALPHLPDAERDSLEKALRPFERYSAATLWAPEDVDPENDLGLTEGEKREAVARFIRNYDCPELDWLALEGYSREVLDEREIHIQVEYDPAFVGGEYDGVGLLVLIPVSLIDAFADQVPETDGVELAFTKVTKLDSMHIISYNLDERHNQYGELIE